MCPTDFQKLIADEGYVFAPNFAKKRKALAKTARRGDVAAQVALGAMCYHGIGVPQNLPEAATWFQMAADKRDREAQFLLGQMYWNGQGVPQDTELATKWLQKAAEQGDVDAQKLLQFISADAIQMNLDRAWRLHCRAARKRARPVNSRIARRKEKRPWSRFSFAPLSVLTIRRTQHRRNSRRWMTRTLSNDCFRGEKSRSEQLGKCQGRIAALEAAILRYRPAFDFPPIEQIISPRQSLPPKPRPRTSIRLHPFKPGDLLKLSLAALKELGRAAYTSEIAQIVTRDSRFDGATLPAVTLRLYTPLRKPPRQATWSGSAETTTSVNGGGADFKGICSHDKFQDRRGDAADARSLTRARPACQRFGDRKHPRREKGLRQQQALPDKYCSWRRLSHRLEGWLDNKGPPRRRRRQMGAGHNICCSRASNPAKARRSKKPYIELPSQNQRSRSPKANL